VPRLDGRNAGREALKQLRLGTDSTPCVRGPHGGQNETLAHLPPEGCRISAIIRPELCQLKSFVYRPNETMFFDNLPLEITCSKCGKQINETVNWLKAESRKCPFCGTLIDTTEFRRGIDEATNRTHEMLQNLQESLRSIKIKIKL
jgi:hypothetical protein